MKYFLIVLLSVFSGVACLSPVILCNGIKSQMIPLNFKEDQEAKCCEAIDTESNEEDVTNSQNVVHPCNLDDLDCIREFLKENSKCCPKYSPVPDPLCLPKNTLYFPIANMTFTLTNLIVTGLKSAKIVEFYYNKKTKNVVLAIQLQKLNETTPNGVFTFRRTAKEPIVLADHASIEFNSLTFTAVIPKMAEDLQLDQAEVHVYIPDKKPRHVYGPKGHTSNDPEVKKEFKAYMCLFPTVLQEAFLFQAELFTAIYIQTFLCNFGIEICSM